MREGWLICTVADLAVERGLIGGPFGSSLGTKDYTAEGVPVIRGGNLGERMFLDLADTVFVSEEKAHELRRNLAEPGDVVLTQRGTLGQVGLVPSEPHSQYVVSQSQMRLRVDPAKALPEFVYWLFRASSMVDTIKSLNTATANPHINLGTCGALRVVVPPLTEQRRIVDLLRALDSYTDGLARVADHARLALPPLMAEAVHEAPMIPLRDVLATARAGGTPSRRNAGYFGGTIPWLKSGEVAQDPVRHTEESITEQALDASAAWLVPVGAVFVAMYGATAGQVGMTAIPLATNQAVLTLVAADTTDPRFLFHWLRGRTSAMKARATGAAQPNLSKERVLDEEIPSLPISVQRDVAGLLDSLAAAAQLATSALESCRRLRSTLLRDVLAGSHQIPDSYDELLEHGS